MRSLVTRLLGALGRTSAGSDPMPELPSDAACERIARSGLFDPGFYTATYGDNVTGGEPLRHYVESGLARGYLPSAQFDPPLYRVTVPGCGRSNPLLHYLEHGKGRPLKRVEDVFPDLIQKHAKKQRGADSNRAPREERVERYLSNIGRVAQQREIPFSIDGRAYSIRVPPMEFFLDRLKEDRPFAFARLPHGFWDALVIRRSIAEDPRLAALDPAERLALAGRIAQAALPHHGGFTEALMEEMSDAIARHKGDPDFFSAVGFKGFFEASDGLFRPTMNEAQRTARLSLYREYFGPQDVVLDATVWKRYADSGELRDLEPDCRGRHVVLLGPDYLGTLGDRWRLARFTHVEIERSHSQRVRREVLERLKRALDVAAGPAGPRPVLLTMCGGSFAYWLFSRLFDWRRDIFCIDLGQSIRIWFPEVDTNSPWMNVYLAARKRREGGG